jgi:hypothetical protein
MADPVQLPIACTLSGASLAERAVWLRRLGDAALIEGARHGDGLELRFRPDAADDVRELVRAERGCCPFLGFELDESSHAIRVSITGPPEAGPVLDDMLVALQAS